MSMILGWLTSKFAGPVASVAAIGLAAMLAFSVISSKATEHSLNGQISALHGEIDDPTTGYRAQLGRCELSTHNLQGALDDDEAQVADWKKQAADWQAKAQGAVDQASAERVAAEKSATSIINMKSGADHCASALDLIRSP